MLTTPQRVAITIGISFATIISVSGLTASVTQSKIINDFLWSVSYYIPSHFISLVIPIVLISILGFALSLAGYIITKLWIKN